MAQAWKAQGTTIGIDQATGTNGSGTYTLLGQVISIEGAGGGQVGERDTTVLTSAAKTNAPTIPDNGEVKISTNYDPTDTVHKYVRNQKDTPPDTIPNWKVTFNTPNTNSSVIFPAWVKEWGGANAGGVEESLMADITLRISGVVTWTNAT